MFQLRLITLSKQNLGFSLKADLDGNGMLNCEEFVTVAVHLKRLSGDEQFLQAFNQFDKNGSGYIEFEELRESLLDEHLGPNNDQFVQDIIFDADLDKVMSRIIVTPLLSTVKRTLLFGKLNY